ncbi:MAG: hypothetical protein IPH72_08790 [Sandaracinaceae bacterium]|nr:hypothetical protein [Sandaracinaceae bacterium]
MWNKGLWWVSVCLGVVGMGCSSPSGTPSGDGSVVCSLNSDCDDGIFCNGRELCDASDPTAAANGCVTAPAPCAAPATCDESAGACITDCPDADGDGVTSVTCGGADCDDADPLRFPGNLEVCDAAGHDEDCDETTVSDRDVDGDLQVSSACCNGANCGPDCDDTRRSTNTGVPEVCDGLDNDCNGAVDEGLIMRLYLDADHDGVADAAREILACPGTPGAAAAVGDCDDTRASVRPTAPEICDLLDNDCDGVVDEDVTTVPWYVDMDSDGWGTVSASQPSVESCVPPANRAIRVGDCNDADVDVSPTALEQCNGVDDDCNGRADYLVGGRDTEDDDLDGVPDMLCGAATSDCNDRDALISVATSAEICDDVDNDCDTRVDEDAIPVAWYVDMDGDRFGDPNSTPFTSCDLQPGRTLDNTDCNDTDAGTHPGASDSCSGRLFIDDDCDTRIDEGGVALTIYEDLDGDGYGTGAPIRSCLQSTMTATRDGDCDDTRAAVNPAALDDCAALTLVDDDCDGEVDETLVPRTFYDDVDGDGYGAGGASSGCSQPAGTATVPGDCDDTSYLRNPGVPDDCATQIGVDDDCDASTDEARALLNFYQDRDDDGFGAGPTVQACTGPVGTVGTAGDCDDDNATRNPGAPDDCSRPMSVDDDCDGAIDEAAAFTAVYRDVDGDGYGNGASMISCGTPIGYVTAPGDCNEGDVAIHPGRPDDCTTRLMVDDDCDVDVDEAVVLRSFYPDGDNDSYGTGVGVMACSAPVGHGPFPGDCDNANVNRNPGRADDCSGVAVLDDDCDMIVDEATVRTTYYRDFDVDTFGDPTVTMQLCAPMNGWVLNATDCDDSRMAVRPGATELCANGLDDDCDTSLDCADSTCSSGCGVLELLSGGSQSAAVHAVFPQPLRVRMRDGANNPLAGRAVTLVTTSITAPAMTATTDAMGEAVFMNVRAAYRVGTEVVRATALGVPDLPITMTTVAPDPGTIFSAFNGPRNNVLRLTGPTYTAAVDNTSASATGGPDGSLYFVAGNRILRVKPDGVVETVAGTGTLGFTPAVPSADARTVAIWPMGTAALALDAPRNRLFYTQRCAIYVVDLLTHAMELYMGVPGTCSNTGEGGLAVNATSFEVGYMAVSDTGVLFFVTVGSNATPRSMRYIDTAGRIATILVVGTGTPALAIGGYLGDVGAIPGESDAVLLATDCTTPAGTRECILRVTTAGELTHLAGAMGNDASPENIPAVSAVLGDAESVEMLSTGEIVIAEYIYDRVRVIGLDGMIRTIAGDRLTPGDTGDGGPGTMALLRDPAWLSVYGDDHLAFWQASSRVIRAIW